MNNNKNMVDETPLVIESQTVFFPDNLVYPKGVGNLSPFNGKIFGRVDITVTSKDGSRGQYQTSETKMAIVESIYGWDGWQWEVVEVIDVERIHG